MTQLLHRDAESSPEEQVAPLSSPEAIRELLEGVCGGRPQAAARLFDSFGPLIYRRLQLRYTRLGLDADDLLQDSFVFYFQSNGNILQKFLDETPEPATTAEALERFLWNQACGIASNRLRSRRRDKSVSMGETPERFGGVGQEEQALAKDTLERLEACLGRGSNQVYFYYKLRFCDGMKPDQIHQTTGWPKKVIYKLRDRLNEAIDRCAAKLGLKGRS